jgi:hypothetical protein
MRLLVPDIHGLSPVIHMAVVVAPADILAELVEVAMDPTLQVTQILQPE